MIPYKAVNPSRGYPWIVMGLIVLNIFCFLVELKEGTGGGTHRTLLDYAFVPNDLTRAWIVETQVLPHVLTTLLVAQFLHGGWFHLLANLLYLWVFGGAIENAFGPRRFLAFYLICGTTAMLAQFAANPVSPLPIVGASGAIAGILGAYLLLYPRSRIYVLVPVFIFLRTYPLPAWFLLGYWFFLQGLGAHTDSMGAGGGIAYFAHVGGFLCGLILARPIRKV